MVPEKGLLSGGLITGPLGHESSTLTTRPWLLARLHAKVTVASTITLHIIADSNFNIRQVGW